jgi:hypothetical protein
VIGATAVIHATTPRVKRAGQGATDRSLAMVEGLAGAQGEKAGGAGASHKMARIV